MEKHKAHLKQLIKDYNEKLSQERKDRALQEKEVQPSCRSYMYEKEIRLSSWERFEKLVPYFP